MGYKELVLLCLCEIINKHNQNILYRHLDNHVVWIGNISIALNHNKASTTTNNPCTCFTKCTVFAWSTREWFTIRCVCTYHDDVIKWKPFLRYWSFVWGIHRSPVSSPQKGQWRGALMFSLMCVWINGSVNNREAGDLRCYRAHHDVIVMADYEEWLMINKA